MEQAWLHPSHWVAEKCAGLPGLEGSAVAEKPKVPSLAQADWSPWEHTEEMGTVWQRLGAQDLCWESYCKYCRSEHGGADGLPSLISSPVVRAQTRDCWVHCSSIFHFFENRHTVFHNGHATLHSHQPNKKDFLSPHPHQQLPF